MTNYRVLLTAPCRVWVPVTAVDPETAKQRAVEILGDDDLKEGLEFSLDVCPLEFGEHPPAEPMVLTVCTGREKVWQRLRFVHEEDAA